MSRVNRLKPVNRHMLIVPHVKRNETSSGVMLPEDYAPEENSYIEATVIDIADDCSKQFQALRYGEIGSEKKIVVERSMVREINLLEKTHHFILENYVVGIYRGPNEN